MIITIDGTIATGKSTVAKKLAEEIGFIFFDTGAMYRTLTYAILKNCIDIHNAEQLADFLEKFELDIKVVKRERHYFVDGEDVTKKIRGEEVTSAVSEIAASRAVRDKLIEIQRNLAVGVNAVFEGRDMGTTVFPDANLKIFLTGRDDVRAKRRYDELTTKYRESSEGLTLEKCLEDIIKRDTYDSSREYSPLSQAEDAYVIDTSDLSLEEIVYKILEFKDTRKTKQSPGTPKAT